MLRRDARTREGLLNALGRPRRPTIPAGEAAEALDDEMTCAMHAMPEHHARHLPVVGAGSE
jgi:hypothetical protein